MGKIKPVSFYFLVEWRVESVFRTENNFFKITNQKQNLFFVLNAINARMIYLYFLIPPDICCIS